ncbi:MAG TPA: hypothetical protein VGL02_15485 [Streptomyces sp.]
MTTTPGTTTDVQKRFTEIRAREQAATPGHWGTYYDGKGTYTVQAQPRLVPGVGNVDEGTVAELRGEHGDGQTYANARFIGHARDDVKFLLEQLDQLEGLVKDLADPDPCYFDHHGYCQAHGWTDTDPKCPDGRAQQLFPGIRGPQ